MLLLLKSGFCKFTLAPGHGLAVWIMTLPVCSAMYAFPGIQSNHGSRTNFIFVPSVWKRKEIV